MWRKKKREEEGKKKLIKKKSFASLARAYELSVVQALHLLSPLLFGAREPQVARHPARDLEEPPRLVLPVEGPQVPPSAHADELEVSGPPDDDDGGGGGTFPLFGVFLSFFFVLDLSFSSFAVPLPASSDPLGHTSVLVAEEKGQRAGEGRVGCRGRD